MPLFRDFLPILSQFLIFLCENGMKLFFVCFYKIPHSVLNFDFLPFLAILRNFDMNKVYVDFLGTNEV